MDSPGGKFALAGAYILAGSSVVAARSVSASLPPFTITFFSLAFAVLTVVVLYGRQSLRTMRTVTKYQWRYLVFQALVGIALFRFFMTFALRRITAGEVGIVTGAAPALTALLAVLLIGDRLTGRSLGGVALAVAGILVLRGKGVAAGWDGAAVGGYLLAFGATACEALFAVMSRKMHVDAVSQPRLNPLAHAGLVSAVALLFCTGPMLSEAPWALLPTVPAAGWMALAWYGAGITILAFALMFIGARRCSGAVIAAYTAIIPLSSLLLSVALLGETVTLRHGLGCGLVVLSVWLVSRGKTSVKGD
ncbi:MAG: DMT family transporter [Planctomycetes bacterium]|nr:DMT family transporter [Planctomycetota bacterium]